MKTILKEYLLYEKNETAEKIISWAKSLMLLKRDKSLFTSKAQILLDLRIISLEEFPEIEKLKPWVCRLCKSINPSSKTKCQICNINKLVKSINEPNNNMGMHEKEKECEVLKCSCGLDYIEKNDNCTKCQGLKPGLKGWVCIKCSTVNANMQIMCECCYSTRNAGNDSQEEYWMCNSCNSYNPGSMANCTKCRSIMPKQEIIIAKQLDVEPKKVESNSEWVCKRCNNSNHNYSTTCAFCRSPKGEQPIEEDKSDGWTCDICKKKIK